MSKRFLRSRVAGFAFSASVAVLPLVAVGGNARAATYLVNQATWGSASTVSSFAWALDQANTNPGHDTINITPGLAINVDGAVPGTGGWLSTITDTLSINGHGATLIGNPSFVSSGGTLYTKTNVDLYQGPPLGTDILTQEAFSFGKVAPGVSLSIKGLNTDGLNGFLQLGNGSTASVRAASARNSVSYGSSARSVFEALAGSTLNITEVVLDRINPALESIGPAWSGAISGVNATLNMARSSIARAAAAAGAVVWSGGVANVVSSLISDSGGLSVRDDDQPGVMNVVNSQIFISAQDSDIQRLLAFGGGELNLTASSVLQDALFNSYNHCTSDPYDCEGKPLTAFGGGTIRLKQSIVSLINDSLPLQIPAGIPSYSTFASVDPGQLIALDSVWLQTTPNQSAADLQSLFGDPALLTSGSPLNTDDLGGGLVTYRPWPGSASPNSSGPLINQISDANGTNQLINPIDGSPITRDVLGNSRTTNNLRTIGAIEPLNVPGPLPLAGVTAALAWSRRLRRRLNQSRPLRNQG